ncbi:hypothetical protein [Ferrimicrobium acidiphilum]|uniref:hypothetical protein n=1 Tax=Ferrimicrobium acidiphilum TaxID=121039 RepID=UPI0012E04A65|nr:hypothetical protein [Ferrimicrobium acidiphilum]
MRELKLFDRTQPQTLQIGVLLLYLNAALAILAVLFGGGLSIPILGSIDIHVDKLALS